MDIIPDLLPIKSASTKSVVIHIGKCCSAKEVVIAVQECVERLQNKLAADDSGSDESQEEDDFNDNVLSPAAQLDTLISLYASCMSLLTG